MVEQPVVEPQEHGRDFVSCGMDEDLISVAKVLAATFEIKVGARLGPGDSRDAGDYSKNKNHAWMIGERTGSRCTTSKSTCISS